MLYGKYYHMIHWLSPGKTLWNVMIWYDNLLQLRCYDVIWKFSQEHSMTWHDNFIIKLKKCDNFYKWHYYSMHQILFSLQFCCVYTYNSISMNNNKISINNTRFINVGMKLQCYNLKGDEIWQQLPLNLVTVNGKVDTTRNKTCNSKVTLHNADTI